MLLIAVIGILAYMTYPWGYISSDHTPPTPTEVQNQTQTYNGTTFTYSGPVNSNGKAEGEGKGTYENGTYEGRYMDGCRQGSGIFVTADGRNTFNGTFKDDEYYEGKLTWEDGSYYKGSFKDDNLYNGTIYNADGSFDTNVKNGIPDE